MVETGRVPRRKPEAPRAAADLRLVGGRLCLDFVNTVDWHGTDHPKEWLTNYDQLLGWAVHAGAIDEPTARQLAREAGARPALAEAALQRAVALREALYRIFVAVAERRQPPAGDVGLLNEALSRTLPLLRLQPRPGTFEWTWAWEEPDLGRPLWSVLASAAQLLTSDDSGRVRRCADDECGWLFVDMSRNRSRRWCSMEDCGNRAKARRHYRRSRSLRVAAPPADPPAPGSRPTGDGTAGP